MPVKVSVLVCTYGNPEWANVAGRVALPSAAEECPYEIIAVHDPDATLAQVRNATAQEADGDWLCFLDADDELAPGYLSAMARAEFSYFKRGAVVRTLTGPRPVSRGEIEAMPLLVPSVMYADDPAAVPTIPDWERDIYTMNCAVIGTLIRKDFFCDVGGFEEEPIYEDWALWLRCIRAGARMVPVRNAVYRYHRSPVGSRNLVSAVGQDTYHRIRATHADVPREVWAHAKGEYPA